MGGGDEKFILSYFSDKQKVAFYFTLKIVEIINILHHGEEVIERCKVHP